MRILCLGVCAVLAFSAGASAASLVDNGACDQATAQGTPAGWETAGDPAISQRLTLDRDPQRGSVAKLACTTFVPGTGASHAMLAQVGRIGVTRGRWYRLSLWARAADLKLGVVHVGLTNFRAWQSAGLTGDFMPGSGWQRFEFTFQAERDLNAADSRLQVWFNSTGTLWVDDVALEETTAVVRRYLPTFPVREGANALANSSFECGGSGWVSWSGGHYTWMADVFQRLGEGDAGQASEGQRSWKLTLSEQEPLAMQAADLPTAPRLRSLLVGHEGWAAVQPGRSYVYSAYVKGDRANLPVRWAVIEPGGERARRLFSVGTEWQRVQISFTPHMEYAAGFVGLEFAEGRPTDGSLWVDAVQLEPGDAALPYRPAADLEARLETTRTGNIFTDPQQGLGLHLRAHNSAAQPRVLRGRLTATDFAGRTVWRSPVQATVAAGQSLDLPFAQVLAGRRGSFRVQWEPEGGPAQALRCANIEPYPDQDSRFGFNHAFAWPFLMRLSHLAGMRWWRNWSVSWQAVQPQPGPFDFTRQDAQIQHIVGEGGRLDVLLPAPAALWALEPQAAPAATAGESERRRLTALKPARLEDFGAYVRASVEHYRDRTHVYEVLNEPLFTHYSLPETRGYQVADYVDVLRTAYQAAHAADPQAVVIGGIANGPGSNLQGEFMDRGGLQWCDVTNYHWYPAPQHAESLAYALAIHWERMKKRGQVKPIWVTEFGLYADDEPAFTPFRVGDETMNKTLRPDELTAAADLVELCTVMFAYGVQKVFYHAGTCQPAHESSAGNIFFGYGGVPRKAYAAQAALARLLPPEAEFVRKWAEPEWLNAYEFQVRGRRLVVIWSRRADAPPLPVPQGMKALDLMGNPLPAGQAVPGGVPIYLASD